MMRSRRFLMPLSFAIICLTAAAGMAAGKLGPASDPARRDGTAVDLPELLRKAAVYCRKLEGSVLDFIAIEEIEEIIDPVTDGPSRLARLRDWRDVRAMPQGNSLTSSIKNSLVYDYQCVRSKGVIREARTLLTLNGIEVNEPNAPLRTSSMVYRNALLSPVNLFGAQAQGWYDYKEAGREELDGRPTVIIEVAPRPDVPVPLCRSGKAWFDAETLDLLKMEWTQMPTAHLEAFAERAARANGALRLSMQVEFSAEKSGLRFPSRLWIREAYIRKSGREFVRAVTSVVFRSFKFFTVETSVDGD
jgi:hypothetical protein